VRERQRRIAGKRSKEERRRRRRIYIFSLTAVGQEADRVQYCLLAWGVNMAVEQGYVTQGC
jgi:hypothetical protein